MSARGRYRRELAAAPGGGPVNASGDPWVEAHQHTEFTRWWNDYEAARQRGMSSETAYAQANRRYRARHPQRSRP